LAERAVSQSDRPGEFDPPVTHLKARAAEAQWNFAPARQQGVTSFLERERPWNSFARKRFGPALRTCALWNSFFRTVF